jgi:sulfate/thiosulfate transport system permease protein
VRLRLKHPSALPGFAPAMGLTVFYISAIVLLPLAVLLAGSATQDWAQLWHSISAARAVAAYRLSLVTAFAGALLNAVFGLLLAWVLVRYRFPGKRVVDALIDLPFALPTSVAGITLTALYAGNGWIGRHLEKLGLNVAFTELGIVIAVTFVGLPLIVRNVQPVLQDLEIETEEAAASLGANRWQSFRRVIFPSVCPALVTGFALAFARGLGEYGSVIFISGNMPMRTETATVLIMAKLEQFDIAGASALAAVMIACSFTMLLSINLLQSWMRKCKTA